MTRRVAQKACLLTVEQYNLRRAQKALGDLKAARSSLAGHKNAACRIPTPEKLPVITVSPAAPFACAAPFGWKNLLLPKSVSVSFRAPKTTRWQP